MRNQFEGICYRCGDTVKSGTGHFERLSKRHGEKWPELDMNGNKWLTQHAECAIKYRGTDHHYLLVSKEPTP